MSKYKKKAYSCNFVIFRQTFNAYLQQIATNNRGFRRYKKNKKSIYLFNSKVFFPYMQVFFLRLVFLYIK